ncbi:MULTISPECIES: DMT family transporter [unclassified Roseibium]|uniref:DMT family transporter n=1 Tax=unclassified Roseibium TaxID=2629323 RepID=UPI00316C21A5
MSAKEFGLWTVLTLLWGCSYLAIEVALRGFEPLPLVTGRMIIGALLLLAVVFVKDGGLRLGAAGWGIAAVVGLTGNVFPFLLISYAEQEVTSGLAALIMGIAPIVTVAVAPLIHAQETLGPLKVAGAAAGFAGVGMLVGPEAAQGFSGSLQAQLALVLAALCYAFTTLFSRKFAYPRPLQIAAASVLVGAIAVSCLLAGGSGESGLGDLSTAPVVAVIYLGVGSTGLAAIIYFYLVPRIGAGRMQQVNYVVPVLGTLLGIAFLGEKPGWNTWIAIPTILLGVYLVTRNSGGKPARNLGRKPSGCSG